MSKKSLTLAAVLAGALLAFGLLLRTLSRPPEAAAQAGTLLFPGLLDELNEVRSITVTTADGGYRIERTDEGFGLAEKGGYPVDTALVRKALIDFAELKKIEPKTADPARYAALGLGDVHAEGSSAKLVTLRGAGERELASLVVGERRSGRRASMFVRKAQDPQSWLVEGDLSLREEGTDWLDKKILELKRAEVRAVETAHPDGELVLVSKASRDELNFHVHDIPPGRELSYASVANGIGGALEYLNLQDVVPAADFELPEQESVRCTFWTFDGLRVDALIHEKDGKTFARFRASHDPEGPTQLAIVGPVPLPEEDEDPGAEGEELEPAPEMPPELVRARAEELDRRTAGWVYEIPAYNRTNLTKRLEGLLKALPTDEDEGEAEGLFMGDQLDIDHELLDPEPDEDLSPPTPEPPAEEAPPTDSSTEDPGEADRDASDDEPTDDEPTDHGDADDAVVDETDVEEDPPA